MRIATNIRVIPIIIFERALPPEIGVSDGGDGLGAAVVVFPGGDGLGAAVVVFPVNDGVSMVCDWITFIEFSSSCGLGMVSCIP